MSIPPSAKYEIIREMTQRDNNLLNIRQLCESAGVSRSGYYHYLNTEAVRVRREAQDRADFEIILEAYNYRGYSKGARGIYMRLLHKDPPDLLKFIRQLYSFWLLHWYLFLLFLLTIIFSKTGYIED